jgi:hypothetical protein
MTQVASALCRWREERQRRPRRTLSPNECSEEVARETESRRRGSDLTVIELRECLVALVLKPGRRNHHVMKGECRKASGRHGEGAKLRP